VDNIKINNN